MDHRRQPPDDTGRAAIRQLRHRLRVVWHVFRSRFAVDTRSLAALRITLGLTLLVDLVHRAGSLRLLYTDDGVYPLAVYASTYRQYTGLSIHALSGELWLQQLLFVIAGLVAVAFLLGYRTRLTGAISLVLLFSLHARNPAVLNGGDRLLRVLLFVALFSPLGERWSIDALRRPTTHSSESTDGQEPARRQEVSFGTVALLAQPLVIFSTNARLKHDGETWYAGDALEIALHNDVMSIGIGNVLTEFPTVLTLLTYGWVGLLAGSVVVLFVPTGRLRALAAVVYIGAFAGMALVLSVGLFPLVLAASVMPYLTAPLWDWLTRRLPARWRARQPTADTLGRLGGKPIERRLLAVVRRRGYRSAADYAVTSARSLLTVGSLLVIVWMLVFAGAHVSSTEIPATVDNPHLDQQRWGLYAPDPSEAYSWYLLEADVDGETTIVETGGTAQQFDRPPDASQTYATFRHRKYMQTVRDSSGDDRRDTIAVAYVTRACSELSSAHDQPPDTVRLYRIYQSSPLDGEFSEPRTVQIFDHECQRQAG